jgi:hypothetical protein
MSNAYNLTTIKDIFDKVPADKIERCCAEIGALMASYARYRQSFYEELEMYGIIIPDGGLMNLPAELEWADFSDE